MRNFQQKHRFRNILQSWPVLGILGVLILFFAWNVILFLGKMQITRENKQVAAAKTAELEQKKEKLTEDIEKLNTEEGKEESIREKFGWAKEGEEVIVIVDEKDPKEKEEDSSSGFFSWFRDLFR